MKKYWILLLILFLASCGSTPDNVVTMSHMGDHEFLELNGIKFVERNLDEDNRTTVGVVSDLHYNMDDTYASSIAAAFGDVEYILILGDSSLNDELRGLEEQHSDVEELVEVWSLFADIGVPVFVMPGNHETRTDYMAAFSQIRNTYTNIETLTRIRILDLDDVAFVAVPGYHDAAFLPADGYLYEAYDVGLMISLVEGLSQKPILISHGPPRSSGVMGVDRTTEGTNIGDPQLNSLIGRTGLKHSIAGHIHEAGPRIVDGNGVVLPFHTPFSSSFVNVGAGVDGHAAIITIEDGNISVSPINLS